MRTSRGKHQLLAVNFDTAATLGRAVLLLTLTFGARSVSACDLCSIYAATEAQAQAGKGLFAGVAPQFTYYSHFQSDGRDQPNPDDERLSSFVSPVFVGYNINNRLGLQFDLPVIYRDYSRVGAHESDLGIGDAFLLANYRVFEHLAENDNFFWSIFAGPKFPTGSSSHLNPAEPDFAAGIGGHDLALGSGSFDGLLGTGFSARWKRAMLAGSMQYAVRSEGDFGYQFANDWMWSGGPGVYLAMTHSYTLLLQAIVAGESKGEDTRYGVPLDDTAATVLYLGPQLSFTWTSKLSAQLAVGWPVSVALSGDQVAPDCRVRAGITWRF